MKKILVLLFVLLLVGCSRQIKIEDYNLEEEYNNETKEIVHSLYFTLYNPYDSKAECNATLYLSNEVGAVEKTYELGEINPKQKKAKTIKFIMPDGDIELNLNLDCGFE